MPDDRTAWYCLTHDAPLPTNDDLRTHITSQAGTHQYIETYQDTADTLRV